MTQPACQILEWDSSFFGFPVARVTAARMDGDELQSVIEWCARQRVRCLYLLAAADDASTARAAEDRGFHLADVRVTLGWPAAPLDSAPADGIRPAREEDLDELAAIAGSSHTDSRFYFDPGFPRDRCAALYETWIRTSYGGFAQAVLVAERGGHAAGYITCHWEDGRGRIGLIAVAEQARGGGAGERLVRESQRLFCSQGVREVSVVTQGRNSASQRLYQRCGFRTKSMELWYHRWFPLEGVE